jgi:hypothetical protein
VVFKRYIAALLFYATHGENWNHKLYFLSESHACDWNNMIQIGTGQKEVLRGIVCNDEKSITRIDLAQNNLNGELPWELAALESLNILRAPWNKITGSLPSQLGLLANLRTLDLNANGLDGTLPTELGWLGQLQNLILKRNLMMKGTIPSTFGKMTNAKHLDLSYNKFSGSIPSEIGSLAALQYLDVSNNDLDGTIPNTFAVTGSAFLNLTMNDFKGNLQEFCTTGSNMIWADCDGPGANIQCNCCVCCDKEMGCNV